MRILCVCEHGNNRSVNFAVRLRYKYKADVIPVGLTKNAKDTLEMLYEWADYIIVPEKKLRSLIPNEYEWKIQYFEVGQDRFPRPFNKELDTLVQKLIEENPLT